MIEHNHDHQNVFSTIANWIKDYRDAVGQRNELMNCTPDEVASIARDIGVSAGELSFFNVRLRLRRIGATHSGHRNALISRKHADDVCEMLAVSLLKTLN